MPTTDVATTARALPDRTEVEVSVVNGADIAGVGRRTTLEMNDLGYLDVILFDGTEIVDRSAIFVSSEWRPVGLLIAEEIGISEDDVLPIDSAPTVDGLGETPVIVYLGRDAETLKLFG